MLICPICAAPLTRHPTAYLCPNGHSYDLARDGYVNLLTSRPPALAGDSPDMLRARRRFLDAGHYAPLAQSISAHVQADLAADPPSPTAPITLLDAGAGDGYYLAALHATLTTSHPSTTLTAYGLDISRDAARLAAKRHPHLHLLVADTRAPLPFATASLRILLDIFAPRNPAEFARILTPTGLLLIVIPDAHHLHEPRAAYGLLSVEPAKEPHLAQQLSAAGLTLHTRQPLTFPLDLTGPALADLIAMTPSHRHHHQPPDPAGMRATAAFIILTYTTKRLPPQQ